MNDTNIIIQKGRLVDKPDLLGNNGDILKFRIAVGRSVKNGENWENETQYFNWVKFKTSEKFAALFDKGDAVLCCGWPKVKKIESNKYKDKDGKACIYDSIEFVCNNDGLQLLQKKRNDQEQPTTANPAPSVPESKPQAKGPEEFDDFDFDF